MADHIDDNEEMMGGCKNVPPFDDAKVGQDIKEVKLNVEQNDDDFFTQKYLFDEFKPSSSIPADNSLPSNSREQQDSMINKNNFQAIRLLKRKMTSVIAFNNQKGIEYLNNKIEWYQMNKIEAREEVMSGKQNRMRVIKQLLRIRNQPHIIQFYESCDILLQLKIGTVKENITAAKLDRLEKMRQKRYMLFEKLANAQNLQLLQQTEKDEHQKKSSVSDHSRFQHQISNQTISQNKGFQSSKLFKTSCLCISKKRSKQNLTEKDQNICCQFQKSYSKQNVPQNEKERNQEVKLKQAIQKLEQAQQVKNHLRISQLRLRQIMILKQKNLYLKTERDRANTVEQIQNFSKNRQQISLDQVLKYIQKKNKKEAKAIRNELYAKTEQNWGDFVRNLYGSSALSKQYLINEKISQEVVYFNHEFRQVVNLSKQKQ